MTDPARAMAIELLRNHERSVRADQNNRVRARFATAELDDVITIGAALDIVAEVSTKPIGEDDDGAGD